MATLSEYFEQHEEQAFVAKALATAVAIILVKNYLSGLITVLVVIFPVVFLVVIRMHAAATGVDAKGRPIPGAKVSAWAPGGFCPR